MELLHELIMGKPLWMWVIFIGIVLALLVLDLGVLHRKTRVIGITESLRMSVFYIGIAFCLAGGCGINSAPVQARSTSPASWSRRP